MELQPQYFQANRSRSLGDLTGRPEPTGLLIDSEVYYGIAILIRREQECAGGIDGEISWSSALGRFMTDVGQLAGLSADPIDDDAVVAPIRSE